MVRPQKSSWRPHLQILSVDWQTEVIRRVMPTRSITQSIRWASRMSVVLIVYAPNCWAVPTCSTRSAYSHDLRTGRQPGLLDNDAISALDQQLSVGPSGTLAEFQMKEVMRMRVSTCRGRQRGGIRLSPV